ncbi:YesL family protein [Bacillus sp. REN16]|uniref:YesL family protein n=1 Tax=Bacillus sp. REN16 TaxID=2887296 RepID=UPI001E4C0CC1|nr:DUF624 domain-containing protein [Bacillus sp. REN16]MCC3355347.1 DUF624 domain-containing protein [Bacillus sp. REN16]
MGINDSKLYRAMDFIMNTFLLNLIWVLTCIPIITIFPATAAMFGVVREWKREGDIRIFASFFRYFKENIKQGIVLQLIWLFIAFLFIINFNFTNQIPSNVKYLLFMLYFLVLLLFIFTSMYLFPVMVQFKVTWMQAIRNALILSISNLQYTLILLLILIIGAVTIYYFAGATMLIFSIAAYCIYSVADRTFSKVTEEVL